MNKNNKLTIAGILCSIGVVGSLFSFPFLGSKAAPVQHMINVISAVILGPWYGLTVAFVTSLLRNIMGLGSIMAFPGSMIGAFLCGYIYKKSNNIYYTGLAEVFGTAVLGGLCAYPLAIFVLGKNAGDIAFYVYIFPFFVSTFVGATISSLILSHFNKIGVLGKIRRDKR